MARCFGDGDPVYAEYHDTEWGVPPKDFAPNEATIFEHLALEVFQVGLSWLLILRRREAFREAFHGFDPARVATLTDADVERLANNPDIIRNRAKIKATITNAKAVLAMHEAGETLAGLLAAHRPPVVINARNTYADLPSSTPESEALTKELKKRGFTFVGPVNVHAMMQALGVVDDHLATCPITTARESGEAPERLPDVWDEARASAQRYL